MKAQMFSLLNQMTALQEDFDDTTATKEDVAAMRKYVEEETNGALFSREDIERDFASR